ncbi:integrase core domain-containing protein [Flavobacterium sp. W21_SRS_FM7]|uniref:integrase core domain-containing protein n=1 Tax=Flavobacterium sp. W21_SRS_FM7 TaxID=3240269 RepID=UPI003F8F3CBB
MPPQEDPYENAVAESINNILKQEFSTDNYNQKAKVIQKVVKEAINIYNEIRPHYSNYMLTPNQMYNQN